MPAGGGCSSLSHLPHLPRRQSIGPAGCQWPLGLSGDEMPDVIDLTVSTPIRNAPYNPQSDLNLAQRALKRRRQVDPEISITGHNRPPPIVISDHPEPKRMKDNESRASTSRQGSHAGSSRSQSALNSRTSTPSTSWRPSSAPNRGDEPIVISSDSDEDKVADMVCGVYPGLYARFT